MLGQSREYTQGRGFQFLYRRWCLVIRSPDKYNVDKIDEGVRSRGPEVGRVASVVR